MTLFAIGAAGLLVLAGLMLLPARRTSRGAAATALAARPAHLILREQLAALDREQAAGEIDAQRYGVARHELHRRILDEADAELGTPAGVGAARSPVLLPLTGLAVALSSIALYLVIGNPAALNAPSSSDASPAAQDAPANANANTNADADPGASPEAMQAMLAKLAQRLATPSGDPANDLQGWTMLARSYAALQRFPEADRAFARAIALAPRDSQLLADRADVLAMIQGQRTDGEPDRLIAEALRIDPRNLKALALAGGAAFERKQYTVAGNYWQQARRLAPDGSDFALGLDRSLAAAREAGGAAGAGRAGDTGGVEGTGHPGGPGAAAANTPTDQPSAAPGAARITGRVSLAPALAAKASPTDTVFIFARSAQGPRMPLAIVRRTVADLPFAFTLDDTLAMSAQTRLSGASRVIVGARVSRSGNAMPQPGDLHGESAETAVRADGLQLVIDGIQP